MSAKRILAVILMIIMTALSFGCTSSGFSKSQKEGPYKGSAKNLQGNYELTFPGGNHIKTSAKDHLLSGKDAPGEPGEDVYGELNIKMKDEKTLEACFDDYNYGKGKPFDLVYDKKTGKAKGKDHDGFEWDIQFESEKIDKYRWTDGYHDEAEWDKTEQCINISYVSRKWEDWAGMGSETMEGYCDESHVYNDVTTADEKKK